MSNPFQTPEFKKLFKEWNEILKETGFEDAEDFNLPEPSLKSWHNLRFMAQTPEQIRQSKDYFELALHVLKIHKFDSGTHRFVWEMHSNGHSIREIANTINLKAFRRDSIHRIISEIQEVHGLKKR